MLGFTFLQITRRPKNASTCRFTSRRQPANQQPWQGNYSPNPQSLPPPTCDLGPLHTFWPSWDTCLQHPTKRNSITSEVPSVMLKPGKYPVTLVGPGPKGTRRVNSTTVPKPNCLVCLCFKKKRKKSKHGTKRHIFCWSPTFAPNLWHLPCLSPWSPTDSSPEHPLLGRRQRLSLARLPLRGLAQRAGDGQVQQQRPAHRKQLAAHVPGREFAALLGPRKRCGAGIWICLKTHAGGQ